jgi:energy-coupling factor transporter ATP-binding protein EcfA2
MSQFTGHNLIVGMTGSGKSTLAKMILRELKTSKKRTAVLDPMGDPSYQADFSTRDAAEFLAFAKRERDCFLFVDEGSTAIGRYNREMDWLATTARHFGHLSTFICHGVTDLSPGLRNSCDRLFLFACAQTHCIKAAEEWNEKALYDVERLERFNFYLARRFGSLKKGSISLDKGGSIRYDSMT